MQTVLLGIDQGSSHTRAVLFTDRGQRIAACSAPLRTYAPYPGWVEYDPQELLKSVLTAIRGVLQKRPRAKIAAIGLANQRSTILCWDGKTGVPCSPAISWQAQGYRGKTQNTGPGAHTAGGAQSKREEQDFIKRWDYPDIQKRTGLPLTPFYSATKLNFLLNQIGRRRRNLMAGTVNTFLIGHLTQGKAHLTDPTNAQRTLLYNMVKGEWDPELLRHFKIPRAILPDIVPNTASYGLGVMDGLQAPITASIGDQQSSLIGLGGIAAGAANINYGSGGFFLIHTGETPTFLPGLLVSVGCAYPDKTTYLIEGTVNAVGTLFTWLQQVGILTSITEINSSFRRAQRGVFCLPALSGLGAPYWESKAKGMFWGLTQATTRDDIIRGAVEAIGYRMNDIYQRIPKPIKQRITSLIATGGLSTISSLLQFQADLFGKPLSRVEDPESTVRGAAFLAGRAIGVTTETSFHFSPIRAEITPTMRPAERARRIQNWQTFVHLGKSAAS